MMNPWPWPSSLRNGQAADVSRRWLDKAREAGESLPQAAADYARDANDELRAFGRRASRSTRKLVANHTAETVLIVGLAAFAVGWLARRMQESHAAAPQRSASRRSTSRTARQARPS
ncbi:MAG TPA: hypothetical protein VKB52_10170 [Rhodanobacteraceae bacterium]|nr:hypothetical protein [Rhodanobacteraceae bacterium]